ncbi:DUF1292 domain-containing protein [Clostridium fallax]|uniref:DUF1292 domain-containing protein n=1 Tax=Clostridium fallax TaxID=1533 RepID=A0A1M4VC31_9CLOT|nr:DUF1292 domain-containing protein [Clostridium fallax]SHE66497.1 hypothetical protein SAMN05443638_10758 [Clostridium fallax]SQB05790.1 Uncharacterised protein [Clostridium fallax]
MSKDLDFIKNEKDLWGKIFVDINYAIDNISPFIEEKNLNRRKYYIKKDILKKYINLLDSAESELSFKKSFFSFLKDNKYENLLSSYKNDHRSDFNQLRNCDKCACLNCIKECSFNSCLGCKSGSYIKKCDKEKINITVYENWILDLTNNNTGISNKYKVLGTLEDCQLDRHYIVLQNIMDSNDKFILYYYPGISEDNYGEITDGEEFDFVVETFEGKDL